MGSSQPSIPLIDLGRKWTLSWWWWWWLGHHHHHHHLFLKCPFVPRPALVGLDVCLMNEIPPHIPEHHPFKATTQTTSCQLSDTLPKSSCPSGTRLNHNHLEINPSQLNETAKLFQSSQLLPSCKMDDSRDSLSSWHDLHLVAPHASYILYWLLMIS